MVDLAANALTTLNAVLDELPRAGDDDKNYLKRQINAASAAIERFTRRSFARAVNIVEDVAGYGRPRITVSRTPLESITSVESIGALTYSWDVADLVIDNPEAGFIYRDGGWPNTAARRRDTIAPDRDAGTEEKSIRVTYTGGYVLPKDQPLTPAVAGAQNLPADLERACILVVSEAFAKRGQRRDLRSERIDSYAASFGSGRGGGGTATAARIYPDSPFSDEVTSLLLPHRCWI